MEVESRLEAREEQQSEGDGTSGVGAGQEG